MGIDPVTHTPRFDVLQLSSILNSLYNSPQFNYPGHFGNLGSVVNPSQLLNLLTTILSCQSRNQDVMNHNFQQNNQIGSTSNSLLQNQSQCSQPMQLNNSFQAFQSNQHQVPVQENHQPCATSNPLHNMESHLMKTKLEHQIISQIGAPLSHQNLWQYDHGGHISGQQQITQSSSAMQSLSLPKFNSIVNNMLENQILSCNNEGIPNFNLSSLLSSTTSSSSPNTLNSSSSTTFVKGTSEDERDTYNSNMLMYNISNGLNDSGFL